MQRTLLRHLSLFYTLNFLSPKSLKPYSTITSAYDYSISPFSLSASPSLKFRCLSSKTHTSIGSPHSIPETNTAQLQKKQSYTHHEEVEDVSNEELKRWIEKYYEGDEDAIPSIFEAILKRKLAGKHDESDDELLEELRPKSPDDVSDRDFDSD